MSDTVSSAKQVWLPRGGRLGITLTVDWFSLNKDERESMLILVNMLDDACREYIERQRTVEQAGAA